MEPELKRATDAAKTDEGGYRTERVARVLGEAVVHPDKLVALPAGIRDELRKSEAGNLAAARRAVEYEIRHLTSEPWKRRIQQATRLISFPALSKPLDRI